MEWRERERERGGGGHGELKTTRMCRQPKDIRRQTIKLGMLLGVGFF